MNEILNEMYIKQEIRLNDHGDFPSSLESGRTFECVSKLH